MLCPSISKNVFSIQFDIKSPIRYSNGSIQRPLSVKFISHNKVISLKLSFLIVLNKDINNLLKKIFFPQKR